MLAFYNLIMMKNLIVLLMFMTVVMSERQDRQKFRPLITSMNLKVVLSWEPVRATNNNSRILYNVTRKNFRDQIITSPDCFNTEETSCDLLSLLPFSELDQSFTFRVIAFEEGNSSFVTRSKKVPFSTKMRDLTGPPVIDVNNTKITSESLSIPLRGPATPYMNSKKGRYFYMGEDDLKEVQRPVCAQGFLYELISPDNLSFVQERNFSIKLDDNGFIVEEFTHLIPCTSYLVKFHASVIPGEFSENSTEIFTTLCSAPPFGGDFISVNETERTSCEHRTVTVSWRVPKDIDRNGVVTHFDVYFENQGEIIELIKTFNRTKQPNHDEDYIRYVTITGVYRWTEYEITVYAFSAGGNSSTMKYILATDEVSESSLRVENLRVVQLEDSQWRFTWRPPSLKHMCIHGYNVHVRQISGQETATSYVEGSRSNDMYVDLALHEHGRYVASVEPNVSINLSTLEKSVSVQVEFTITNDTSYTVISIAIAAIVYAGALALLAAILVTIKVIWCTLDVDISKSRAMNLARDNVTTNHNALADVQTEQFDSLVRKSQGTGNLRIDDDFPYIKHHAPKSFVTCQ